MPTSLSLSTALLAAVFTLGAVNAHADQPPAADNTKANAADRDRHAKTPTDQSNDQNAREVTAGIRRAVMDDKSLSTSAHNVKIVTEGDVVTLRGAVQSADEKKRVEALATKVATGKQVRNEMSVAR